MTSEPREPGEGRLTRRELLAAAALSPLAVAIGPSQHERAPQTLELSGTPSVATVLRKHALEGLSEMELCEPSLATSSTRARLEKELSLIEHLGLSNDLLTAYDLVHHYGEPGFLALGHEVEHCSLVAFVLGIVRVSPISQELTYEDFAYEINLKRRISLDVCSLRWDELVEDNPESLQTLRIVPKLCLTLIHRIHTLIRSTHNGTFFGLEIPLDDPATYQVLSRGETEGIPFFDQPQSQQALCRLRPEWFHELVAFFALEYGWFDSPATWDLIAAKHDHVRPAWPAPIAKAMTSTYGQVLYREQVFRIIQVLLFCDYESAARIWSELSNPAHSKYATSRDLLGTAAQRTGMGELLMASIFEQFDRINCDCGSRALGVNAAFYDYTLAYLKAHFPAEFNEAWQQLRAEQILA